jgi:hypothetical protein
MDDDTAIVGFSILSGDFMGIFFADKKMFVGDNIDLSEISARIYLPEMKGINENESRLDRAFSVVKTSRQIPSDPYKSQQYVTFEKVVNYYRFLLSNPALSGKNNASFRLVTSELYRLLFSKISDLISAKKKLIIIMTV